MKIILAAGLIAASLAPFAATTASAQDVGEAIARGAIRGALGDAGPRGYDRDRYEGRSGYEGRGYDGRRAYDRRSDNGDCRTITVERDDGSVKRIRRCD